VWICPDVTEEERKGKTAKKIVVNKIRLQNPDVILIDRVIYQNGISDRDAGELTNTQGLTIYQRLNPQEQQKVLGISSDSTGNNGLNPDFGFKDKQNLLSEDEEVRRRAIAELFSQILGVIEAYKKYSELEV
jgi:hypothetical protein